MNQPKQPNPPKKPAVNPVRPTDKKVAPARPEPQPKSKPISKPKG